MKTIDKLIFASRPFAIIALYRILYPLGIIIDLLNERENILSRASSPLCVPIQIFSFLHIPIISEMWINFFLNLLMVSLFLVAIGLFTRFSTVASFVLFFWVIGSSISCTLGTNPDYVNWQHCIVVFNLFVLIIANSGASWSLDALIFKMRSVGTCENWPIFLLKFNIVHAYFSSAFAKFEYGFDWANGYTLQGHMIYTHLHANTPQVLPYIQDLLMLKIFSWIVLASETFAPLALFFPVFTFLFVIGTLLSQVLFYFLIDLRWMHYFGWSYLIYIIEGIYFVLSKVRKIKVNEIADK